MTKPNENIWSEWSSTIDGDELETLAPWKIAILASSEISNAFGEKSAAGEMLIRVRDLVANALEFQNPLSDETIHQIAETAPNHLVYQQILAYAELSADGYPIEEEYGNELPENIGAFDVGRIVEIVNIAICRSAAIALNECYGATS